MPQLLSWKTRLPEFHFSVCYYNSSARMPGLCAALFVEIGDQHISHNLITCFPLEKLKLCVNFTVLTD